MSQLFTFRSKMPASAEAAYRFHAEPGALERLTPLWEKVRVVPRTGGIETPGSRATLRVSIGPFTQDWIAEHASCEPGKLFRDVMVSSPFRLWVHTHKFLPVTPDSSWLEDAVEYQSPPRLAWSTSSGGVHPPSPPALIQVAPQGHRRSPRGARQ